MAKSLKSPRATAIRQSLSAIVFLGWWPSWPGLWWWWQCWWWSRRCQEIEWIHSLGVPSDRRRRCGREIHSSDVRSASVLSLVDSSGVLLVDASVREALNQTGSQATAVSSSQWFGLFYLLSTHKCAQCMFCKGFCLNVLFVCDDDDDDDDDDDLDWIRW